MNIKVRDLKQTEFIENDDKLMVLVDDDLNLVKNITKEEFLTNIISEAENNALIQEEDGNLYVNTSKIADSVTELENKLSNEIDKINTSIGNLDDLTTEDKANLVVAINEAATKGGGSGGGRNMFELVVEDHVLSYKESNGKALLGSYVYKTAIAGSRYGYPDFYNTCLDEFNNSANTTEELNGVTVTINPNGHMFYDIADKDAIDEIYEQRGEAYFFGIDEKNERIFLPRISRIRYTDDINEVGGYQEAGLPNITATAGSTFAMVFNSNVSGAFSLSSPSRSGVSTSGNSSASTLNFNASRSDSIYGNSDTVEYSSTKMLLYMVVGNVTTQKAETEYVDVTASDNDTLPPFTPLLLDTKANHISWVKADTEVPGENRYKWAYGELVKSLNPVNNTYGVKVVDVDAMEEGVDYSAYWKINQTEQTIKTPAATAFVELLRSKRVLISKKEPTENDETWFNLYSDGYCEQGGFVILNKANDFVGIPLQKKYKDSTYSVLAANGGGPTSTNAYDVKVGNRATNTPDTVYLLCTNATTGVAWRTVGYAEPPTKEEILNSENVNLYFKVGNAVENIELINVGELTERVNSVPSLIDGQWVPKVVMLAESTSIASNNTLTFDVSEYLPKDEYNYEVLLSLRMISGSTSGYNNRASVYSDVFTDSDGTLIDDNATLTMSNSVTRASSTAFGGSSLNLPVGPGRKIYIKSDANQTATIDNFKAIAYRRTGKNK